MLYITYNKSDQPYDDWETIKNIWEIKVDIDPVEEHKKFIHEKAKELGIVINPHWLNLMNREDHNKHLSIQEHQDVEKQWNKILRQWNIDKFISDKLKGKKQKFKVI